MQYDDVTAQLAVFFPASYRRGRECNSVQSGKRHQRHHRRHQHGAEHATPPLQRQGTRPHEQPLLVRLPRPSLSPH